MKFLPVLAGLLVVAGSAVSAEQSNELKIDMDEKVIYCMATLHKDHELFSHALHDGIPVTIVWRVEVDRVRNYWLNESVAGIEVVRRVIPDLLSRSWLLEDQASGISRKVYAIEDAIRFLANLEHLPVLDRTLLRPDKGYLMHASIEVHIGEVSDAWWAGLLESEHTSMSQAFSLP